MGRADARSAQIGSPAGISQIFQVSAYSGEPFTSILARNLFSKDRCRPALGDERVKSGPQVSFVGMAFALSRARKRLTRTGASPDAAIIGPACKSERVGPAADARKEMALRKICKFVRQHVFDRSLIDFSVSNYAYGQAEGLLISGSKNIVSHMNIKGSGDALNLPLRKPGVVVQHFNTDAETTAKLIARYSIGGPLVA